MTNEKSGPALSGREAAYLFRMLALARERERPLLPALSALGSRPGLPQLQRLSPGLVSAGEESLLPALGEAISRGVDAPGAPFLAALVRAGLPATGLRSLSLWFASRTALRLRFAKTVAYPLTLTVTALFAASFLLSVTLGSVLFDQVAQLYAGLRMGLPAPTRAVLSFYALQERLFANPVTALLYGVILAGAVYGIVRFGLSFHRGRLALWLGLGRYLRWQAAASVSESLALLLEAGVPLPQAYALSAGTVENERLKRQLLSLSPRILAGENLGECLRECPALPASVTWRIWSAYFGGSLPRELTAIAALSRSELAAVERRIQSAAGTLAWGLSGVAFLPFILVIVAFYMPLFQMMSSIG